MYLLGCHDSRFTEIGDIINPENAFQRGFFSLYSECMAIRAERQTSNFDIEGPGRHLKCNVF